MARALGSGVGGASSSAAAGSTAAQIEAGTMGSYVTPEEHREHAAHLEELARRL